LIPSSLEYLSLLTSPFSSRQKTTTALARNGNPIPILPIYYLPLTNPLFRTRQHDETFLVTQGTLRFHALNGATIDAKLGDYVTVPPRSPHTFSNPYDEEAKFFNTYTPAFYINYFKLLSTMSEQGKPMDPEANRRAMAVSSFLSCVVVCGCRCGCWC
jgi:mannose-6-phosphate isomerase-like protein (cupin superfamily)